MSVFGVTSVAGSPGVTTTAVAWALHSTRETVLVEADTAGGSAVLAGILRGEVAHEKSLLSVPSRPTHRTVLEQLTTQQVQLTGDSTRSFIPGFPEHHQARAMAGEWTGIAQALHTWSQEADVDVVIDLGRVTTAHYPTSLMAACDYVVAMCLADLPHLHRAHTAVAALKNSLGEGDHSRVGLATVEAPAESYSAREVRSLMAPTTLLGEVPHNPTVAATYSLGAAGKVRSLRPWVKAIGSLVEATRTAAREHAEMLEGR